jgi:hypothetical protein
MSTPALDALLAQYQAGLDAELTLLARLEELARHQERAGATDDLDAFHAASDQRDRIMESLIAVEQQLVPVRRTLLEHRQTLAGNPAFEAVAALHRHTAQRVAAIVAGDDRTMASLRQMEQARRTAIQAIEQGEQTLAAYRRVIAPAPERSALFSRKG